MKDESQLCERSGSNSLESDRTRLPAPRWYTALTASVCALLAHVTLVTRLAVPGVIALVIVACPLYGVLAVPRGERAVFAKLACVACLGIAGLVALPVGLQWLAWAEGAAVAFAAFIAIGGVVGGVVGWLGR